MPVRHLTIRVSGLVQGVFYRESARRRATELGVNGFVRNEGNGTVYIEAESESNHALDAFVDWCREGPPAADVDDVAVSEAPPQFYTRFFIAR